MADYYDVTLALAGVCQSARLVHQFAHHGEVDETAFRTSLSSLLQTEPDSLLDVFGGDVSNLKLGLATLLEQTKGMKGENDAEIGRYWLSLLALESKLNKSPEQRAELARRIQYLPAQLEYCDLLDPQMLTKIAGIYVDVVSPLGSRIQVKGSPLYLQQPAMHNNIRACLLAGIRSAVLWRQMGGTKWQILFSRSKIRAMAQQIYSSL